MSKCSAQTQPISLYCLKYAESVLPENMAFLGGSKTKLIPISFAIYLIKTKNRSILVDAGCDTMPGFIMDKYYSPAFVLRQINFTAEEITDVIITHAHHDHIEALSHFKNATVHITEEEYLNGKKRIPENMLVDVFKDNLLIDEQINVVKWGGHSVGSAIVEITDKKSVHILAGDEFYVNDCITRRIPTGCYHNLEKSKEFLEKYSNNKYCVHTCHDISLKTERII